MVRYNDYIDNWLKAVVPLEHPDCRRKARPSLSWYYAVLVLSSPSTTALGSNERDGPLAAGAGN